MRKYERSVVPNLEVTACLGFAVRKAARVITQLYDEALAPVGLKSTQFSLLNVAAMAEGAGINKLAELLVMDRTTLTRNLKPLIKAGLIESTQGTDRRMRSIRLTADGRARLNAALPMWRTMQERVIKHLGADTADRLRDELAVVVKLSL